MVYRRYLWGQTARVPVPPDLFTMGDVVRKLRQRLRLSQQQLAKKSGVSVSAVKAAD